MRHAREKRERFRGFVKSFDGKMVEWGVDDCTATVAKWILAESGVDVGLPAYRTQAEASRLIVRAGSLASLWDEYLTRSGFHETFDPGFGDIGVIDTSFGQVGVIFSNFSVAYWRAESGFMALWPKPSTVIKAWSLPQ